MLRRSLLLLAAPALLLLHCGETIENVCDYNNACAGGDAGTDGKLDGSGDTGIDAPPGCDLAQEPKDSPACVADSVGMFVDATNGNDTTGDGSKLKPMQTIGAALGKVGNKPRIYVCEGTYAEDVVLDASHDGVSLYGGWKCADWSYSGVKPVVGKGTLALKVDGVTKPIVVADLEIKAADAVVPGGSSIGALLANASDVSLTRDNVGSGKGLAGANGVLAPFTFPDPSTVLKGKDAAGNSGGPANPVTCPGGAATSGGKGGDTGMAGVDGLPVLGGGLGGAAGPSSGQACTNGTKGSNATNATDGAGATLLGQPSGAGWAPGAGMDGPIGSPGQGGGGGGGQVDGVNSGGGGGGGAGGCGGAGGPAGKGGGASIGILVFSTKLTITDGAVASLDAGAGGAGIAGQPGQATGGAKGNGSANGCSSGGGGIGGNGGAGGGGAGGISVGILWKGTAAPTVDASTTGKITVAATGGLKGIGGAPGTNDGIDGVAQAVLEVK